MQIVVAASDEQWNALTKTRPQIKWQRVTDAQEFIQHKDSDAFFNLVNNHILPEYSLLRNPVIVNSVISTLKELDAPGNVVRINGWALFLERSAWEIAGMIKKEVTAIFETLNVKINKVEDEPGFIAARIIAMIVNEAYLAVADEVSTKAEIDTAMKLGTNYPYGPFEWVNAIGIHNIFELLQKLNVTDNRYQPAALLIKEVNKQKQ